MMTPACSINWLAVCACVVLNMIMGSLWYSPMIFGNVWRKLINLPRPESFNEILPTLLGTFINAIIVSAGLAWTLCFFHINTYCHAITFINSIWLFFVVPSHITTVLWVKRSWKAVAIETGFLYIFLLLASIIIVALS